MKRTEVAYLWVASIMSNNATLPQEHVFLTLWLTQVSFACISAPTTWAMSKQTEQISSFILISSCHWSTAWRLWSQIFLEKTLHAISNRAVMQKICMATSSLWWSRQQMKVRSCAATSHWSLKSQPLRSDLKSYLDTSAMWWRLWKVRRMVAVSPLCWCSWSRLKAVCSVVLVCCVFFFSF